MKRIYLVSPSGGYATASNEAGAAALEAVSSFRRCDQAEYQRVRTARRVEAEKQNRRKETAK